MRIHFQTKSFIKKILRRCAPDLLFAYQALKLRRWFKLAHSEHQNVTKNRLFGNSEPYVLSGPFAGLRYLNETVWSSIEPKWLGTYELELHSIIERILRTAYDTIIDVGSAEGYYSVGLGKRLPSAVIHSYDVDPWARAQQRRLARLNGVENIVLGKYCDPAELEARVVGATLVICDIEGEEYELLNPECSPSLRRCDILVEMHPHNKRRLSIAQGGDYLAHRFSSSHDITKISYLGRSTPRDISGVSETMVAEDLARSMEEFRFSDQMWLWLKARDNKSE